MKYTKMIITINDEKAFRELTKFVECSSSRNADSSKQYHPTKINQFVERVMIPECARNSPSFSLNQIELTSFSKNIYLVSDAGKTHFGREKGISTNTFGEG